MSPSTPRPPAKRVPYKARRDRREIVTAIVVFTVIVVVTMSLVWFLRPNRDSTSPPTPDASPVTSTTTPTDSTDTTATTAPAATDTTTDTTAPAASGG